MKRGLGIVIAVVVLAAACGDDDAASTSAPTVSASTTTEAVVTTTASGSTTTVTTATTTTSDTDGVISITVAIGSAGLNLVVDGLLVEPGSRIAVETGATVHMLFSGSVAEELHIHGYDLSIEIAPGGVEVLDFVADIPGIFEVELEGAGTLAFELEVS